jgi:hypothetical protein
MVVVMRAFYLNFLMLMPEIGVFHGVGLEWDDA